MLLLAHSRHPSSTGLPRTVDISLLVIRSSANVCVGMAVVLGSLLKWSLRLCAGLVESSLDLTLCCLQIHLLSCTINIRHTWQLRSRVAFLPETNTLHILWWLRLKSFVLITNQPFPVLLAFHIPSLPS